MPTVVIVAAGVELEVVDVPDVVLDDVVVVELVEVVDVGDVVVLVVVLEVGLVVVLVVLVGDVVVELVDVVLVVGRPQPGLTACTILPAIRLLLPAWYTCCCTGPV